MSADTEKFREAAVSAAEAARRLAEALSQAAAGLGAQWLAAAQALASARREAAGTSDEKAQPPRGPAAPGAAGADFEAERAAGTLVTAAVTTRVPSKWRLLDLETGETWRLDGRGRWLWAGDVGARPQAGEGEP